MEVISMQLALPVHQRSGTVLGVSDGCKRLLIVLFFSVFALPTVFAQASIPEPDTSSGFQTGIILGSDILPTGPEGTPESWTRLGLTPDFSIGKFGIGLDLTFRFRLFPEKDRPFALYEADWIPSDGRTFLDIYLPKLLYVRYGQRGVDPVHAKLGSIRDFTLGNGFIVGDYSNMRFLPETRIFGAQAGIDGSAFGFPYAGVEMLAGNLSRFDVLGGRIYLRPLAGIKAPLFPRLQIGATLATDRNPYLYGSPDGAPEEKPVTVVGADITVPIIGGSLFPLTASIDAARQTMKDDAQGYGFSGGVRGRLLGFITYSAGIRVLQEGFIPSYFDSGYDLYRSQRSLSLAATVPGNYIPGWLAGFGTTLFKDRLYLWGTLDAPFGYSFTEAKAEGVQSDYAHFKAAFGIREGLIPKIFIAATYEKYFIGRKSPFTKDVFDPTDAAVGIIFGYKVGASVLAFHYDASWNPSTLDWDVKSSIDATVKF